MGPDVHVQGAPRVIAELICCDPENVAELLCLSEVDDREEYYKASLARGYESIIVQRQRRSRVPFP